MTEVNINVTEIMEALPHRYPFLLVDRVIDIAEDEITAIKNVTINEEFFQGHFPQYPVMPGVLIMEALAQAAGVLELSKPENKGKLVFYAGMDNVKYKNKSLPEINWSYMLNLSNVVVQLRLLKQKQLLMENWRLKEL